MLEIEEFLARVKPDIFVLCETKWKDEWKTPDIGNGLYDIWLKNQSGKGGGGVMIMTRKSIRVERVDIS